MTYWVHKNRQERYAKVHRAPCEHFEVGDAGSIPFHSYIAAWRSASMSELEASNCPACKPEIELAQSD